MSKAILMSINPRWCELIARGEKTIEIRKTIPKDLTPPFKVYIYMTAGDASYPVTINGAPYTCHNNGGKEVIGEFVCRNIDTIDMIYAENLRQANSEINRILQDSCLSAYELLCYLNRDYVDKNGYAYNISDLVIYERAKNLREFNGFCREAYKDHPKCDGCEYYYYESNESSGFYEECQCGGVKPLTRPPQSWCYVEEV